MRSKAVIIVAVALLSVCGCQKKAPESTFGSTDTIRTGAPGNGSAATNSTGGASPMPTDSGATTTADTAGTSGSAAVTATGTVPTDTTASTRTK